MYLCDTDSWFVRQAAKRFSYPLHNLPTIVRHTHIPVRGGGAVWPAADRTTLLLSPSPTFPSHPICLKPLLLHISRFEKLNLILWHLGCHWKRVDLNPVERTHLLFKLFWFKGHEHITGAPLNEDSTYYWTHQNPMITRDIKSIFTRTAEIYQVKFLHI